MKRGSLTIRIALLAAAIAVITAVIGGVLAFGLIRRSDNSGARATLARVATAVAADGQGPVRNRLALRAIKVSGGTIGPDGKVVASTKLARDALTPADIRAVLAGRPVSTEHHVDGSDVLVEARPTTSGGIFVIQRRADAQAVTERVLRRLLVALAIAVAVALVLGVLVARRLARPLRKTASAAHALASGDRAVSVAPEGPAEVAEVAAAVNTLAGHLAASEARQREFLLSVSHDLRTPLTAITGYAESLADGVVPAAEVAHVGGVMTGEARRLDRLVADLLDLARLEAQDLRVESVPVDVDDLLLAAGTVWADRCAAAGVEFSVEREAAGLIVNADPGRLRQVLDGLLENALRVTPAGRPIVISARRSADDVVLEVRDGGPGLTDDDLRVAFDRSALYDRYRGVRQVGTGLGLAIVARLCERMGARVEAGHAAEGGARFTVTIPAHPYTT
ncbi:MAG TPA: HAMP domain-containing sensor histidine kinase [Mycobacteriales bacterium]